MKKVLFFTLALFVLVTAMTTNALGLSNFYNSKAGPDGSIGQRSIRVDEGIRDTSDGLEFTGRKSLPAHLPGVGRPDPPISLGDPGLSFRHSGYLGYTEDAYLEDTHHLFWPYGITTDGNNLWVVEQAGRRALKYSSDCAYITQIGKAGYGYGPSGTDLDVLSDVGIDSSGNIWLVDLGANYVAKFDLVNGEEYAYPCSPESGKVNFRIDLSPAGSALFAVWDENPGEYDEYPITVSEMPVESRGTMICTRTCW